MHIKYLKTHWLLTGHPLIANPKGEVIPFLKRHMVWKSQVCAVYNHFKNFSKRKYIFYYLVSLKTCGIKRRIKEQKKRTKK